MLRKACGSISFPKGILRNSSWRSRYSSSASNLASTGSTGVIRDLRQILPFNGQVLSLTDTDEGEMSKYLLDWTKSFNGGSVVVLPRNTQEVSAVVKYCHGKNIKVVPQGGNTSLSGASIPCNQDELVLSLATMNSVISVGEDDAVLVAESGCILQDLATHVDKHQFMIPLDLGSKGSCMIGGNVATNAGGLRVYRYGSLHHNVLGLEVVLADGTILNMLKKLRKDNSGYPLKHLFIGSEGTLGKIYY